MVLGWLSGSKGASVSDLINRRQYNKALDLLWAELKQGSRSSRLRLQIADVLVLAGRGREAVPLLTALSDEFARDGFAAKAIAVLKKAERIRPGDNAVERRLAGLIQQKEEAEELTITPTGSFNVAQFDIEEIQDEPAAASGAIALELTAEAEQGVRDGLLNVLHEALEEASQEQPSPEQTNADPLASPLFSDFSQEELVAVIRGLKLLSFRPGDIIISQGEAGDSLFVLSSGRVRAWVRNGQGRHEQVREMAEGAFFGEISILSGSPRSATITACTACELLELDRKTLDEITRTHPRVLFVLQEFYRERTGGGQAG